MIELFGLKIKELRESKNLTQAELARELNVTKQTISAWEKNLQETDFSMLIKVAKFFNVTVNYLLGLDE